MEVGSGTGGRSRLRSGATALAWLLLGGVYVVVAAGWLWSYDVGDAGGRTYDAAALAAFLVRVLGVHVGIAGTAVLALALIARRWRYAAACVPVIVFLLWPVHDGIVGQVGPTSTDDAELVIMSVNLRRGADGATDLLRQIRLAEPDVLVLQEYTDTWHEALADELRREFPHVESVPRPDPQGIATYSRIPFVNDDQVEIRLGDWDVPMLRTRVPFGEGQATLFNAHLPMPLSINAHAEQRVQVARLARLVDDETGPVVVVGDLNHTETTLHLDALLDAGVRSAWDEVHRGRGETWRRPGLTWVPGLRLDHVLVSDDVDVVGMRRGDRGESDHWPLIVGLSPADP